MRINVCFTPQDYLRQTFVGGHSAVVIDVLRATTSITAALANGCRQFIPVATVEEAQTQKKDFPDALLGGERQARLIPGFDLGNSPFEYSRGVVEGKTIIMTTTNGTLALKTAEEAASVYTGSFVNAAALCDRLSAEGRDITLLCAGTLGRFSLEDALCAGLITERLSEKAKLGDAAMAVQAMYRDFCGDLAARVARSSHAVYLLENGFAADVGYCLQTDVFDIVPEFRDNVITA
ncbi:MAG: 2-phosphosulfolactate phosphatase [Negativicutes bacterium]|nr:2-phosphosulfolactate phosphatase [Negativicutes bacterium]